MPLHFVYIINNRSLRIIFNFFHMGFDAAHQSLRVPEENQS